MKLNNDSQHGFQIISNGIRFGYGFRTVDEKTTFRVFRKTEQK